MSILRPRLGSTFVDVCNIDYRILKDGTYYRVKGGDYVFRNGTWEQIICALPFKWIIDTTGSSCEKQDLIVDVPITLTSDMGDGSSIGYVEPNTFKKNVLTGNYIFNLGWKFNSVNGVGPGVYMEAFGGGAPSGHLFIETPIGQITDPSLYPSSEFHLYGLGCFGKALAGKIDTAGRIWMTSGEERAITAWNPGNPIFVIRSSNLDAQADFNGINLPVNTGYAINTKAKKVTDNISELPLDDNNQLTSQSGLPQSTKTILITDPDYRTVSADCPVPAIGFGNVRTSAFFTKQCTGGFTGTSVEYVIPANTFYGSTQLIANNKAADAIAANGQNYANSNGICNQTTFWNTVKSAPFSKNDCAEGQTTAPVDFVIPAMTYSASTQIAADQLAIDALNAGGQAYANEHGVCNGEPCALTLGFTIESEGPTTASATVVVTDGTAPYTYLWSNGDTTATATGLDKGTEYTVHVEDSNGCVADGAVTPNVEVLTGLKVEVMYFVLPTIADDPYAPRPCGTGTHNCNRARFDVLANGSSIGIANLNNAGGTSIPDGTIDDNNTPPDFPDYPNSDPLDRYFGKVITGVEAAEIADESGNVTFTLFYTGIDANPHSDAAWIKITKEDGTILATECVNVFDEYVFDPYA